MAFNVWAPFLPIVGWITLPVFLVITLAVVWRALRNNFKGGMNRFIIRIAMSIGLILTSVLMILGESFLAAAVLLIVVLLALFYWRFIAGLSSKEISKKKNESKK